MMKLKQLFNQLLRCNNTLLLATSDNLSAAQEICYATNYSSVLFKSNVCLIEEAPKWKYLNSLLNHFDYDWRIIGGQLWPRILLLINCLLYIYKTITSLITENVIFLISHVIYLMHYVLQQENFMFIIKLTLFLFGIVLFLIFCWIKSSSSSSTRACSSLRLTASLCLNNNDNNNINTNNNNNNSKKYCNNNKNNTHNINNDKNVNVKYSNQIFVRKNKHEKQPLKNMKSKFEFDTTTLSTELSNSKVLNHNETVVAIDIEKKKPLKKRVTRKRQCTSSDAILMHIRSTYKKPKNLSKLVPTEVAAAPPPGTPAHIMRTQGEVDKHYLPKRIKPLLLFSAVKTVTSPISDNYNDYINYMCVWL